jgi:hypothetical protein
MNGYTSCHGRHGAGVEGSRFVPGLWVGGGPAQVLVLLVPAGLCPSCDGNEAPVIARQFGDVFDVRCECGYCFKTSGAALEAGIGDECRCPEWAAFAESVEQCP